MSAEYLQSLAGQHLLKYEGHYSGALDGIWGPLSKAAARKWFETDRRTINTAISSTAAVAGRPSDDLLRTFAGQIFLTEAGFYSGKIDGIWGPLSKAAAERWADSRISTPAPSSAARSLTPYDVATRYLGVKEIPGKEDHPLIIRWLRSVVSTVASEETAWCSAFANYCAAEAGYEKTGSLAARSWLQVGETVPLEKARKGDVVILWRVSKSSWQGHVAFLDHHNAKRGLLYLLGGNQNDAVNITAFGVDRLLGVRRLRTLDQLQGSTSRPV